MTRILLVDDHAAFREPLALALEREEGLEVVAQAGSVREAREALSGADVAIVDLDLGGGNGAELIPDFLRTNPGAAVLVLSASQDRSQLARAVQAGAGAILHKSTRVRGIVNAVHKLSEGQVLVSPTEAVELMRVLGQQREQAERDRDARAMLGSLTHREMEVLQLLADGLNDKEISERLHISPTTQRTHMRSILSKLGAESRLQAVLFALRHGAVQMH